MTGTGRHHNAPTQRGFKAIVSQDDVQRTPPWMKRKSAPEVSQGDQQAPGIQGEGQAEDSSANASDETVGTGTSLALGCIAGTVLLILIGLIFIAIAALF